MPGGAKPFMRSVWEFFESVSEFMQSPSETVVAPTFVYIFFFHRTFEIDIKFQQCFLSKRLFYLVSLLLLKELEKRLSYSSVFKSHQMF